MGLSTQFLGTYQTPLAVADFESEEPAVLDTLVFLLGDGDAGVRFAAVVALGASPASRARVALARHVSRELDAETRKACESALARKVSERRIA